VIEQTDGFVAAGRRVIAVEAEGLRALGSSLGPSFGEAVRLLLAVRGRVIVSGMGKSGHVARKIAATFASTGTPSHFVHPAEASHGDLGMIAPGDVVLLLSNSGETPELADLIAYTRRFSIPLIGVASRGDSTLIRRADIGVVLPQAEEACGLNLAPTTTTTMTLALGDALAVVLMERRRFTPEDFRGFHPGGRLGARLVTVEALMHRGDDMPLIEAGAAMGPALIEMSRKGFGTVGVTDGGRLVGVITDGDLRRNMEGLLDRRVEAVMSPNPRRIATTALASEALGMMNAHKITTLFATDPAAPDAPAGILHVHDLLRAGVT
jgi:arabinose-5-phosphate isomerase